SRVFKFDYSSLAWGSRAVYVLCGYLGFEYRHLMGGALAGLMAGVTDSTLGWALSAAVGPYMKTPQPHLTVPLVSIVIVIVTLEAGFFGFVGALFRWPVSHLQKAKADDLEA